MAELWGGVAPIKVGVATEIEVKKKARFEYIAREPRATIEESVESGGGFALVRSGSRPSISSPVPTKAGRRASEGYRRRPSECLAAPRSLASWSCHSSRAPVQAR